MQPLSRQKMFGRLRSALMAHAAFTGAMVAAIATPAAATPDHGFATPGPGQTGAPTFTAGGAPSVGSWAGNGAEPQLDVKLNQARTIIDWQGFNIGAGQTTNFIFDHDSWIVLNRVQASATIAGNLSGCVVACPNYGGNIWLYSSSGIFFNAGTVVNTGGLLATTSPLGISDTSFLVDSPVEEFDFGSAFLGASVIVRSGATINSTGGTLAFVAPIVRTEAGATITTPPGSSTVLYGATQYYRIQFQRDAANQDDDLDLVSFEIPSGPGHSMSSSPLVLDGTTQAGNVQVVAKSAIMSALISAEGTIVANSAAGVGGDVILSGNGTIALGTVTAGRDVLVSTTGAAGFTEDSPLSVNSDVVVYGPVSAGRDVTISTGGAALAVLGQCDCSFSPPVAAEVYADSSISVFGDITAGRNATLNTSGAILPVGDGLANIDDVYVEANSSIYLDAAARIAAGGDVTVTTHGSVIAVSDSLQHTNDNYYFVDSSIDFDGDTTASGTITLETAGALVDIGDIRSSFASGGSVDTTVETDSSIHMNGSVNSTGGSVIAHAEGASVSFGDFTSPGTVAMTLNATVTADSSITVAGSATGNGNAAGDGVFLATTGAGILFGTRTTPGNSAVTANLFIDVPAGGSVQALRDVSIDTGLSSVAGTFNSFATNQAITVGGTVGAGLSVYFDALSSIAVLNGGGVTAGTDLLFDPDTIVVAGNVTAAGDITMIAQTSIDVTSTGVVDAGQNGLLTLRACECGTSVNSFINVSGNVSAGTGGSLGNLTLNTVDSGIGNITLGGNLNAAGATTPQYVTLLAQGAITQSGSGVITADILTGFSIDGATLLGNANRIDVLGAFRAATDFTLANAQALDVQGMDHAFDIGSGSQTLGFTGVLAGVGGVSGNLNITTTGAGSNLALSGPSGNLTATGASSPQNVVIASAGSIVQAAGRNIAARNSLNMTAGTSIDLAGSMTAGAIINLLAGTSFSLAGTATAGADANFNAGTSMSVGGTVTAAAAASFSADSIVIGGLVDSGANVNAVAVTTINVLNTGTADAAVNASLTAGTSMTVAGSVLAGTGGVAGNMALTTTAGNMVLPGSLTAAAAPGPQMVTLRSGGSITQGAGGVITTDILTGFSAGATALSGANRVGVLDAFRAGTDFGFTNAQALDLQGLDVASLGFSGVTAGAGGASGDLTLATTGANNIVIGANVTAAPATGTQVLTLISGGAITQAAGTIITADVLTGSSVDGTILTNANRIGVLDAFRAGTNFTLTNAQALDVQGADVKSLGFTGVTSGNGGVSGDLALVTTGAASDLTLGVAISNLAGGPGAVSLTSGAGIAQNAGTVTGNTVTLTAAGNIALGATAGGITAQNASFTSTGGTFIQNGGAIVAPAVAITANTDILIGDATFTTAVVGLAADQINVGARRPPITPSNTGQRFIDTGSITLQAAGKIVQQNTGTDIAPDGLRVAAATPLIRIVGQPAVVDLFGTLIENTTAVPPIAVALSNRVVVTGTNNNWRINSCIIHVAGACSAGNNIQYNDEIQNFQFPTLDPPKFSDILLQADDDPALANDPTLIGSGNDEISTRGQ